MTKPLSCCALFWMIYTAVAIPPVFWIVVAAKFSQCYNIKSPMRPMAAVVSITYPISATVAYGIVILPVALTAFATIPLIPFGTLLSTPIFLGVSSAVISVGSVTMVVVVVFIIALPILVVASIVLFPLTVISAIIATIVAVLVFIVLVAVYLAVVIVPSLVLAGAVVIVHMYTFHLAVAIQTMVDWDRMIDEQRQRDERNAEKVTESGAVWGKTSKELCKISDSNERRYTPSMRNIASRFHTRKVF
jgi:hypothetical protein